MSSKLNKDSNHSKLNIGDLAPDFELLDTNQQSYKLSDHTGKTTILAFFPASGSPVCTVEMCNFRDSLNEFTGKDAQIIGISVDNPFANKIFSEHHNFNFPILSDYNRDVIEKYDVVMPNLGKLKDYKAAKRAIFIIDNQQKIKYKWISDNPLIEPRYDEIRNNI